MEEIPRPPILIQLILIGLSQTKLTEEVEMSSSATANVAERTISEPETFSFCVGRPWPKSLANPDGTSISVYTYGSQVHHGTMTDAEGFRDYVNERTGEENFIYKLVPISPQS